MEGVLVASGIAVAVLVAYVVGRRTRSHQSRVVFRGRGWKRPGRRAGRSPDRADGDGSPPVPSIP